MDWRTKRKTIIALVILIVLAIVVSIPVYFIFFTGQPTCFDGIYNGDERGIDCGGSCIKVCEADAEPLSVISAESFRVTDSILNSVAVIENKNKAELAKDVPYTISILDSSGRVLDKKSGKVTVEPQSRQAIFASGMKVSNDIGTETKVTFGDFEWIRGEKTKSIFSVGLNPVTDEDTAPRVTGSITNNSSASQSDIQIIAVVSDDEGNAVGVSSTFVTAIKKDEQKQIFFTWPEPFYTGSRVCDARSGKKVGSFLGDFALVIDRSGSMDDESLSPPEPLNTVRLAAIRFAESMRGDDRGSLISFANVATVDESLTNSINNLVSKIDNVEILTGEIQNTNLGDGLLKAHELLSSQNTDKRKAIIVLTDGIATRPTSKDDKDYPENYAKQIASSVKDDSIEIYVIGLGKEVNTEFLIDIAGTEENYFSADKKEDLFNVYDSIATSICSKRPSIITTYIIQK